MQQTTGDIQRWYAIRVTYCRELAVKSYLDNIDIECYVPMYWTEKMYCGKKRRVCEPLIHNLIFIRTSAECLKALKTDTDLPICYIMDHGTKSPMVVPDGQMDGFIAVVSAQKKAEIVDPGQVDLADGDRVRVTEGPFKGIEGIYVRHKGRGRVAVTIRDVATALTAYIPLKYIEKL